MSGFSPEFLARLAGRANADAKTVETTHRAELELGPPITAEGLVRWLSASALVKFDPNTEGGCPLRGWYHYVGSLLGLCEREPETPAMHAGTGMHKEIEDHLRTGAMCLGPIALAGKHFIPTPGPGLCVEWPVILHPEHEDAAAILAVTTPPEWVPWDGFDKPAGVWLRIAGIPYAGHLDLYNHRGEYIDAEGTLRGLPPATLECKDWKSTSDLQWAKNSEQVANAIPMIGYAMSGFTMWPQYERAQLTHVYFSRGKREAKLATALRERGQIERRWEYATGIARSIIDIAREVDPTKIPTNTDACHAYNQPCPRLAICPAGRAAAQKRNLTSHLGPRMAALVAGDMRTALGIIDTNHLEEDDIMGLLKQVGVNAPEVSVSFEDLLKEEDAGRAEVTAPKGLQPIEGFDAAWGIILSSGMGRPPLKDDVALMYTTGSGTTPCADLIEGDGKLSKLAPITDPLKLIELGRQIKTRLEVDAEKKSTTAKPPKPAPPIQMLAPDAPASTPALAADPVEGLDNAKTRELATATGQDKAPAVSAQSKGPDLAAVEAQKAKDAELAARAAAAEKAQAELAATEAAKTAAPAKRGRPPGSKNKTDESISIYVDVTVDGLELKLLDDYVAVANKALSTAWGCKDVRTAPNDTEGGYNRGPTILVTTCQETPPPPGAYYADSRQNPLVAAVAVGLRSACLASGGVFVRGFAPAV